MSATVDRPMRDRPILVIGALVVSVLAGVAGARLAGYDPTQAADAQVVASRSLRFTDGADGSIAIADARTGERVARVAPGEDGFIRGTMRGLARERKRRDVGADVPFELVARADGRLTLLDPATGRRIDLESFGPDNVGAFAKLMFDRRSP